jgi:hypothetical protein
MLAISASGPDLGGIIKTCLQFVITDEQLDKLENDIISWVQTYEQYFLFLFVLRAHD